MIDLAPAPEQDGSRPSRVRVTDTLSRGLAARVLAVLCKQGNLYRAHLPEVLRPRVRSKKAVGRAKQQFLELGERTKLIQVIGSTPNQRQVTVCQFVPEIAVHDGQRRALQLMLHQFILTPRGIQPGADYGVAFMATEHAVERLFLRLNTLDLGAVVTELHDAMLLALPLWVVGLPLRLRQVALPTSSGAFVCDVDPDRSYLCAKTWISHGSLGARWSPVVDAVTAAVGTAGGASRLHTTLCMGVAQSLEDPDNNLFAELAEALSTYPWLRETYTPRADPVGQAWKAHATGASS